MPISAFTVYEFSDLEWSSIPPRSRLYSLEPIGAGTPYLESLTSFLVRLAEVHCVSTDTLFTRELLPLTQKANQQSRIKRALTPSFRNRSRALNGTGILAECWVQALEKTTLRKDLRYLTLLTWSEVLSQRQLLRAVRAWCPLCYEHWRENKQVVYDPLLWALEAVTVCAHHLRLLQLCCPYCAQQLPLLDRRSRPGYCSKCRRWLGISSKSNLFSEERLAQEESNWQIRIVNSIEELIAAAPLLPGPPSRLILSNRISTCIDNLTKGSLSKFASLIQKPKTTVWGWQKGKMKIPLEDLLWVCYRINISPLDFLTKESILTDWNRVYILPLNSCNYTLSATHPRRAFAANVVRAELDKVLKEYPPPSMQTVATRQKYNKRFLSKHFPDLCREISARHREYKKTIYDQKSKQCREEIRQVAIKLYRDGIYPSRRRVAKFLTKPGDIERKEAYQVLREVLRELGLG